jgi:hypothetical protein
MHGAEQYPTFNAHHFGSKFVLGGNRTSSDRFEMWVQSTPAVKHDQTSAPFVTWRLMSRAAKVKTAQGEWMTAIRHAACI